MSGNVSMSSNVSGSNQCQKWISYNGQTGRFIRDFEQYNFSPSNPPPGVKRINVNQARPSNASMSSTECSPNQVVERIHAATNALIGSSSNRQLNEIHMIPFDPHNRRAYVRKKNKSRITPYEAQGSSIRSPIIVDEEPQHATARSRRHSLDSIVEGFQKSTQKISSSTPNLILPKTTDERDVPLDDNQESLFLKSPLPKYSEIFSEIFKENELPNLQVGHMPLHDQPSLVDTRMRIVPDYPQINHLSAEELESIFSPINSMPVEFIEQAFKDAHNQNAHIACIGVFDGARIKDPHYISAYFDKLENIAMSKEQKNNQACYSLVPFHQDNAYSLVVINKLVSQMYYCKSFSLENSDEELLMRNYYPQLLCCEVVLPQIEELADSQKIEGIWILSCLETIKNSGDFYHLPDFHLSQTYMYEMQGKCAEWLVNKWLELTSSNIHE
jgi:hypothetical protein